MNSILVLSVDITGCRSDSINWLCERGKLCICEISGSCSNGNLLVYEEVISSPLCSPQISDRSVAIDWSICDTSKDNVKIRADCDEEQSSEKMIILTGVVVTTTISPTTSISPTTIVYTGSCGADGYCDFRDSECLEGYQDCPEYDGECHTDEKCCCLAEGETTSTIPGKKTGFGYGWVVGIVIIIAIVVVVYFFFIKKGRREEEIKRAFRKLYEKWGV